MVLCPILNEYLAYDFKRLPIHDISHDYGKFGWCRRCAPAQILKDFIACFFILFSTKRTSLQFIKIMVLCPILNEYLAYDFKRLPIHDISHDYGKFGWCRRCAPAQILKDFIACFFILFSTKRTSRQFTIGHRHLHVRVQHVDILRKRLPPSNLHCLSKDDELEMDNT